MVRRALDAVRDVGEASYYDYPDPPPISALCARAPAIMCSAARPGWAYDPYTREQRPLKQFSPSQQNQLWQYAVSNGQALKKSMDKYVGGKQSRLNELAGKDQDLNVEKFYTSSPPAITIEQLDQQIMGVSEAFQQAACSDVEWFTGFSLIDFYSANPYRDIDYRPQPVLALSGNEDVATLISFGSYAEYDKNDPASRAYSSTLTWNAYQQIAGENVGNMKYHMRAFIVNDETLNSMTLAHQKFPGKVKDIPRSSTTGTPEDPVTGHGIWVPEDEAYTALLSTPLVKVSVNMIIDRSPSMQNPYISEIHTFGEIRDATQDYPRNGRVLRHPMIVVKYGPAPFAITPSPGPSVSAADEGTVGLG